MKKLKHFLATPVKNGYSPVCTDKPTSKVVLGLGALTGTGLDLTQVKWVPESNTQADKFPIESGDFLVSRSNTLDKVGRAALYRGGLSNCSYPDLMMKFRVDEGKIIPDFMELILQSAPARKHFMRCASGTSSTMAKITKSVVESLKVPEFSMQQQQSIVKTAREWDNAIEKKEALIAAKEKQFEWLCQTYFKPGNSTNSGWEKHKIATFVTVRNEREVPSEEVPLYSLTIENGVTAKTDRYNREFLVIDKDGKKYKVVHPKDIVFNPANLRWGAIARSEVEHKVVLSPIYEVLKVDENKIDSDFLTHALTCSRQIAIFATMVEGTLVERMAVKIDTFLSCHIHVPSSKEEQKNIAHVLNLSKQEISLLKKTLEQYRSQKRGLMQKLLTGEWQVSSTQLVAEGELQDRTKENVA
jgi:type I restriction enzyme S subunit